MKIIINLFFILSYGMLNDGNASKEHVHFKIHVPEIINHHIHTRTVFIHIHKPGIVSEKMKPKEEVPKKLYHKEHHKNWSSWSTYGYHNDYDDNDLSKNQKDQKDESIHKKMPHKNNNLFVQPHRDSYMPALQHDDNMKKQHGDIIGYSYPPQYAVQENVKETDHNDIEPYIHMYEEGHQKSGESANGHIYMGDLMKIYDDKYEEGEAKGGESARGRIYTGSVTKFYDDKHEEGDHSVEEYKNESKEKTHAGRYFVDDYQQNSDKYEAEKRVSPIIFA